MNAPVRTDEETMLANIRKNLGRYSDRTSVQRAIKDELKKHRLDSDTLNRLSKKFLNELSKKGS